VCERAFRTSARRLPPGTSAGGCRMPSRQSGLPVGGSTALSSLMRWVPPYPGSWWGRDEDPRCCGGRRRRVVRRFGFRRRVQKGGGVRVEHPPAGLPLLCGLLLASGLLRGLLRHFSSWSGGCSVLPTVIEL